MAERIYLNDDWKFSETFREEMLKGDYEEVSWETVRLPHTCKETPFHYFDEHTYQMVSAYRKILPVPIEWEGLKIILTIDGAAHASEVYLNGKKVGMHNCGYTAFSIDLSSDLLYGTDNTLFIKLDSREDLNIPPFGFVIDYMTYGGIYRDVYLDIKNPVYLRNIFVHSKPDLETAVKSDSGMQADVKLVSEITLNKKYEKGYRVRQFIRAKNSGLFEAHAEQQFRLLGEAEVLEGKARPEFDLKQADLWDTKHPHLYEVKTELWQDGKIVDTQVTKTGFREARFVADGFYLNGEKLKIRGLNRHQSFPYAGYAMPESMQKLDADILKKELGVNAVRTSHYPQSHYFLDRCDELGLLVFTEIPGWQHIGDREWKKQAIQNVKDMVLQYRNHTSIILWGVRINESKDDDAFYKKTNEVAHRLDPTRQTGGVRAHKRSHLFEDVYTYNDFSHDGTTNGCEPKEKITSDLKKPYLVSEFNGHMYPTKSFDCEEHGTEQAIRHANVLDAVAGEKDIAGCFGWCMFDYNTHKDFGSGDRICYHGVLDMFRNQKPAALIYACQQEEIPVLELSSSMDIGEHPGCNRGKVYIYTNADSVLMYKNDRFIKEYTKKDSPYQNLLHGPLVVDDFIGDAIVENEDFAPAQAQGVKYILNAAAGYGISNLPKSVYLEAARMMALYRMKPMDAVELYNKYVGDWGGTSTVYRFEAVKNGEVVKTIVKKPMTKVQLEVWTDHTALKETHSYDVAAVRICAKDENGNILRFYNEPLVLETKGPIALIGPRVISLQGGMGGTYVKTTGETGEGTLKIKSAQTGKMKVEFTCSKER